MKKAVKLLSVAPVMFMLTTGNLNNYGEQVITVKEEIPYEVQIVKADYLDKGQKKIIKQGEKGIVKKNYKVKYENGKIIERKLLAEKTIKKSIKQVEAHGILKIILDENKKMYKYKKVLRDMEATAYTNSIRDTGKDESHPEYGITFTGTKAKVGTVAVDPEVIPLGSKLYVEGYGYAVAEDTGSAIKGYDIDLFVETQKESDMFGRQTRDVYILKDSAL